MKTGPPLMVWLAAWGMASAGCRHYGTVRHVTPVPPALTAAAGMGETARENILRAVTSDAHAPRAAVAGFLNAASAAAAALRKNPSNATARETYNFALARVFGTLRGAGLTMGEFPLTVSAGAASWELSGIPSPGREIPLREVEFIPADETALGGSYTRERLTKTGLGAPLIAVLRNGAAVLKKDRFAQGKHLYYGVTAVARFEGARCAVSFEDPLSRETTRLDGHEYPLAGDFTAPMAYFLAKENPRKLELSRLLRPDHYADTARLARLQPYDAKKIPVVFVHGLKDSPATWIPLLNVLRADPAIREHYQFWFFSYPSGYPYPHSAAILREQLDEIKKRYPGHKDIVLIGHSMGGCISRLMITDAGDRLWREFFGVPPEKTALSPATKRILGKSLLFQKRGDVGRVIFLAAPLRGTDLATNWPGRIGSRLVKSPLTLMQAGSEALRFVPPSALAGSLHLKRMPNSVDTMSPKNLFVRAINRIEPDDDIPYHVIVGDRGKGGNPDRTKPCRSDGVVPYWSSHMEGARSELIVHSRHSVHQNPGAIQEARRILRAHLTP